MASPDEAYKKYVPANPFDRKFGGTKKGVADPYITGYHFIYFRDLPKNLSDNVKHTGLSNVSEIQRVLSASCLSVTPPGGTLNKTEFTGLGGIKYGVPTNVDYNSTLTMKFLEYSTLPILDIFHGWIRMIRDYRTGVTTLQEGYSKSDYASTVLFWTTQPDGRTVEYYSCYTGVFPTKDPQDLYSSDLSSNDKLEPDIEFHTDMAWHEDWVYDACQTKANDFADEGIKLHGGLNVKADWAED